MGIGSPIDAKVYRNSEFICTRIHQKAMVQIQRGNYGNTRDCIRKIAQFPGAASRAGVVGATWNPVLHLDEEVQEPV